MPNADTTDEESPLEIHPWVVEGATFLGLAIAALVGALSFKQSFSTLHDLALLGEHIADPWVTPIVLDGPILAAGVIRVAMSQHQDSRTVRGRRFVVAVLILTGMASMAGNAYHTILLGSGMLHAAVAAGIAALAPLMVIVMSEVVSIILRAPRRRPIKLAPLTKSDIEAGATEDTPDEGDVTPADPLTKIDDDLEGGNLSPEVWKSVELFLDPNEERNYATIAEMRGVSPSTISRQIAKWQHATMRIAATRSANVEIRTCQYGSTRRESRTPTASGSDVAA
ncbi:DUF2637 domain-containing protein [Rhodococcoides kyotonense]|uniref:DUF2637 domain-containing protein n=1 Tax=Rhodococcoides kyotonense TaxID=398843 RepID=A0A177YKY4_9NOCA|nr:DUF2637 domain-containing protein [Rhodococcus kyotonensis]OAK56252.1 hypothetical protein A3K89_17445 [Rhodococcus kyotonensis]